MKSPAFSYAVLRIDHGLAAVAAFAVDVLEQVQGERLAAIKQQAIALLQVVDLADCDLLNQQTTALLAAGTSFSLSSTARSSGATPISASVDSKQRGQHLERLHHAISIGFLALRGEPNRLVCLPPEHHCRK